MLEFWEYSVTQYNTSANSGGLVVEYVSMFLKLKQELSGHPSNGQNEVDKEKYTEDYRRAAGISLDETSNYKNVRQHTWQY